jgi:hypothetical protein
MYHWFLNKLNHLILLLRVTIFDHQLIFLSQFEIPRFNFYSIGSMLYPKKQNTNIIHSRKDKFY